jgi:hypothetical protein
VTSMPLELLTQEPFYTQEPDVVRQVFGFRSFWQWLRGDPIPVIQEDRYTGLRIAKDLEITGFPEADINKVFNYMLSGDRFDRPHIREDYLYGDLEIGGHIFFNLFIFAHDPTTGISKCAYDGYKKL